MTEFLKTVDTILRFNCSLLSVPLPSVRIAEPSEFATVTTKCAVSSTSDELLINKQFAESNADTIFLWLSLSHECRHIWQAKNSADMLKSYKTSADVQLQDYNEQVAEVDAWAWAVIVLTDKFHVRPTLEKNFGAKLWAQIQERARQIVAEDLF